MEPTTSPSTESDLDQLLQLLQEFQEDPGSEVMEQTLQKKLSALDPKSQMIVDMYRHETRVSQGLKKSLHRFQIIQNLCEEVGGARDVKTILDTLMQTVPRVLAFKTAALYLGEPRGGGFAEAVSAGFTEEHRATVKSQLEEGIIPWVFSERRAVVIPQLKDVRKDSEIELGFVIIPFQVGEKQIGFMIIVHDSVKGIQEEIQLGILELMARQVAVAIDNCRLYEELRDANRLLRRSQQQVIAAEKMAAIGVLAGGVAHEINNPLQVLLARLQLLKREKVDPSWIKSLDEMEREANRIAQIVRSILRHTRNQTRPELQSCQINSIIQDVLTIAQSKLALEGIETEMDLDESMPDFLFNPGEIGQVLSNLIENARHAMTEGGTLSLRTKRRGRNAFILVEDTGVGIQQDRLQRVFEPFYTTKDPNMGTGLGLFLCYQIVERHGGRIQVESVFGEGTRFTIQLPLIKKQ